MVMALVNLSFALSVTASVQLVGVYLVFASLIVPALVARSARRPTIAGYLIGAAGYGIGLQISVAVDLPPGPVIVWTLAVLALLAGVATRMGRARSAA